MRSDQPNPVSDDFSKLVSREELASPQRIIDKEASLILDFDSHLESSRTIDPVGGNRDDQFSNISPAPPKPKRSNTSRHRGPRSLVLSSDVPLCDRPVRMEESYAPVTRKGRSNPKAISYMYVNRDDQSISNVTLFNRQMDHLSPVNSKLRGDTIRIGKEKSTLAALSLSLSLTSTLDWWDIEGGRGGGIGTGEGNGSGVGRGRGGEGEDKVGGSEDGRDRMDDEEEDSRGAEGRSEGDEEGKRFSSNGEKGEMNRSKNEEGESEKISMRNLQKPKRCGSFPNLETLDHQYFAPTLILDSLDRDTFQSRSSMTTAESDLPPDWKLECVRPKESQNSSSTEYTFSPKHQLLDAMKKNENEWTFG